MNLVEGRRRLRLTLIGLSGGLCSLSMVTVLLVHGVPYNPIWWPIMGLVLVASFVGPALAVPIVEWVLKGYMGSD